MRHGVHFALHNQMPAPTLRRRFRRMQAVLVQAEGRTNASNDPVRLHLIKHSDLSGACLHSLAQPSPLATLPWLTYAGVPVCTCRNIARTS